MTCWSKLGRRCIDTTTTQDPRLSKPIQRGSQHSNTGNAWLTIRLPARPLTARGPPSMASVQPVPARTVWPERAHSEIAAGNRSTGCWAAPGITDRFGPQAVCQPNQWAANDDTRPPRDARRPCSLATSRPHCNIERLESLRFFGTCGAHPGSVAQVLVAKGREVRTSCPRRRWRMEVPLVSDQREDSYRDLHSTAQ